MYSFLESLQLVWLYAGKDVGIRVVDSEDNDVPVGEVGEVIIQSLNNMKGYWNRPEATAESIKNGWFYSGDKSRKTVG